MVGPGGARSPIEISSHDGSYAVTFESSSEALKRLGGAEKALFFIVDRAVAEKNTKLIEDISAFQVLQVDAVSSTKSLEGVASLASWLIESGADKGALLVGIGGGAVQDLVSFTAHVYKRGVPWGFLPTTLLSQADSCIGAKSGINLLPYKNQLGAFHAPTFVNIDSGLLETLPRQEMVSGLGEILKLSLISDYSFFDHFEEASSSGHVKSDALPDLVRRSLVAKKTVIEEDEREEGPRKVLNYGHSFGHAYEALLGHNVPHGVAVAWGIQLINFIGVHEGVTDPEISRRVSEVARRLFPGPPALGEKQGDLISQLKLDKKVSKGLIDFVFMKREGDFLIRPTQLDEKIDRFVSMFDHELSNPSYA